MANKVNDSEKYIVEKATEKEVENIPVVALETQERPMSNLVQDQKVIADPLKEIILVDKNGNETITTKAFYEHNKESFEIIGVKLK